VRALYERERAHGKQLDLSGLTGEATPAPWVVSTPTVPGAEDSECKRRNGSTRPDGERQAG
jgi:hypothetical protein